MNQRWWWLLLIPAILSFAFFLFFTGPSEGQAEEITRLWFESLVERDFAELAKWDARAPREREGPEFERWVEGVQAGIAAYEDHRDSGFFQTDENGYALVRGTLVGGGTYWESVFFARSYRNPVLVVRLNFGYGQIYYGSMPFGTTVYLLGYPMGTVHPILLGRGEKQGIDILRHLDLRIRLERVEEISAGDSRYKVRRIEWIEESVQHELVEWIF